MYKDISPSDGYIKNTWNGRGRSSGKTFGGVWEQTMNPNVEAVSLEKNFCSPAEMANAEKAGQLRNESKMRIVGSDVPLPTTRFGPFSFPEEVLRYIEPKKYITPTPVQSQGWPVALSRRDMVGIAGTGSGKTISFVLPALNHAKN